MEYSNAQKLAAVVSTWARPAISQIAAGKLSNLSFLKAMENHIKRTGLVGENYKISMDIEPFMNSIADAMLLPLLEKHFSTLPDASLPKLAHSILNDAISRGQLQILEGLVTFEENDLRELKNLLAMNMPIEELETYQIKR